MSDLMNDATFLCGDEEGLISYLYDDCDPAQRAAIAAHLVACSACAEIVDGLSAVRRCLPAWTPPDAELGFQITAADQAVRSATGVRPVRWWQRPLPAWAQAAAAALIFLSGLVAGAARGNAGEQSLVASSGAAAVPEARAGGSSGDPAGDQAAQVAVAAPSPAAPPVVLRDDLARLERELREEIGRVATLTERQPQARPAADDEAVLARVQAIVDRSEERQRAELARLRFLMAETVGSFEAQRRYDLAGIQRRVEEWRGQTVNEVKQNRDAIGLLMNAWYAPAGRGQGGDFRPVGGR